MLRRQRGASPDIAFSFAISAAAGIFASVTICDKRRLLHRGVALIPFQAEKKKFRRFDNVSFILLAGREKYNSAAFGCTGLTVYGDTYFPEQTSTALPNRNRCFLKVVPLHLAMLSTS